MSKTRNNHYVPQWYQSGFFKDRENELRHLKHREIKLKNSPSKVVESKNWFSPAQCFYEKDLYSTFFGEAINDDIEKKLFGPIDDNGSDAIRAFLTDDLVQWHEKFQQLFIYLDAQKLRTPKGLDWVKSKYPHLTQVQLMTEMQALRTMHCTLWAEGVRELVSAENSDVKFILSDHPVTVYNFACPPGAAQCKYPGDPDIALKGSQTIFPLDKNRCLILTNLEYAKNPEGVNPLEPRTNARKLRTSLVSTINFINKRKLSADEVTKINYIIKSRAKESIAAGKEGWLYPEKASNYEWSDLRHVLLPPSDELFNFGGEMIAGFDDGSTHYQDAFGRTTPENPFLKKQIKNLGRNDLCGCGSGRKYKYCCDGRPEELRTSWSELSIRERNLAFCRLIRRVLGLNEGRTWTDVRRTINEEQITQIYGFYATLWPRDTDVYALLPKSDGKFRGLYTGVIDVRVIEHNALPMASLFDEFLIESPIINPAIVRPEFSPTEKPALFKYQALRDILWMLLLEPYIDYGLVNLIPDPGEFDLNLMRAMIRMARSRTSDRVSKADEEVSRRLRIDDFLNQTHMQPRAAKLRLLTGEFGMPEEVAESAIDELEATAEQRHLCMLQPIEQGENKHFMQLKHSPNFEMSLFIAQVTGSVIVTDSASRWDQLQAAQHREGGLVSYPWDSIYRNIGRAPLDLAMLESGVKAQNHFAAFRAILKEADQLVLAGKREPQQIDGLAKRLARVNERISEIDADGKTEHENCDCTILAPHGGIYDRHVQRLLALSSCPRYDDQVRAIYYVR